MDHVSARQHSSPSPDSATDPLRWQQLFTSAPRPMWVIDVETLRFLAVNDAASATYGWSQKEFLELSIRDIRPPEDAARAARDVTEADAAFKRSGVWRHRWRDGTLRDVEITSHDIAWEGRPARIVLVDDITERRAAEQQLWVLNEKLRAQAALLDLATDGIVVHDLAGRVSFWNSSAARIFGWSQEEAHGKTIEELMGLPLADMEAGMPQLIADGNRRGQYNARDRNGVELVLDVRITVMRSAGGAPQAVLAIITDITAQRKLESQLLRAQRLESIGTLAGGIAHDLNNMLSPIMMSMQLLADEVTDDGRDLLDTISRSAKRGADLVKQVLAFARGIEGDRTPLQVSDILHDTERLLKETLPRQISFVVACEAGLPDVIGDATQLHQVILNLCVNARDAMPEGGEMHLSGSSVQIDSKFAAMARDGRPGTYVCIEVSDSGNDIPREILDRIFDPFFTTKPVGVGTGLGLSTVQSITRSHGGFVNVYSEPGKGTAFRVYLPSAGSGEEQHEDHDALGLLPRGNGELVLVVDDEAAIRTITKQTLETFGYSVLVAVDGMEALHAFREHRHDIAVVLTDMMMPNLDGPGLISAILHEAPDTRIIAASGLGANGNVAKAASMGITRFLPKPYTAETLLAALAAILGEG